MRLTCPLCGTRDRREFYYYGAADYLDRPDPEAGAAAWDAYLHLRDNPAGVTRDLWYHEMGCSAWLLVERNTVTHEVMRTQLVADHQRLAAKTVRPQGELRESPPSAAPPADSRPDGPPKPRRPRAPRKAKGEPT